MTLVVPRNPAVQENSLLAHDHGVHDWYGFVLAFPPHLVRAYLSRFAVAAGQCVLDPFCGTGTTLVECQKAAIVGAAPTLRHDCRAAGRACPAGCTRGDAANGRTTAAGPARWPARVRQRGAVGPGPPAAPVRCPAQARRLIAQADRIPPPLLKGEGESARRCSHHPTLPPPPLLKGEGWGKVGLRARVI